MNKVYKVIWSKIKHQYVVVSELANGNGKCPSAAKRGSLSLLAALVLTASPLVGIGGFTSHAAASEHYSVNNDSGHDVTTEQDFNDKGQGAGGIGSIAAGFKTGANGITSSVVGAYSYIGDVDHLGQPVSTNDSRIFQGATSAVFGSFNTVKTDSNVTKANQADGVANSVVGQANLTENSNGTIIMGAGNKVTNSYRDLDTDVNQFKLINADILKYQEVLGDAVAESGGQVMAMGGGNTVNNAYQSQVMGVGNTLEGVAGGYSEDGSSRLNYIEGFNNTIEGLSQNDYVIGSKNKVTAGKKNIIFGDNHTIKNTNNNVIIGSSDEEQTLEKSGAVQIGHNAKVTQDGGVALGEGSIASKGVPTKSGFGAASTDTNATWKATAAAVSVGDTTGTTKVTRQISNVAAGSDDTALVKEK